MDGANNSYYIPSYEEINHNLATLSNTLERLDRDLKNPQGKHLEAVDLGFIEIFKNDIAQLKASGFDAKKVDALDERLQILAEKMGLIATKILSLSEQDRMHKQDDVNQFNDVVVPLIRPQTSLKEVAKDFDGDLKAGLEALDSTYDVCQIRGDGHCLFRAIAAALVRAFTFGDQDTKDSMISHLDALEMRLTRSPYISGDYFNSFRKLIKEENLNEIMNSPSQSDFAVDFLRRLASAVNYDTVEDSAEDRADMTLTQEALARRFASLEDYLNDMVDMKRGSGGEIALGGAPELIALGNALGIEFAVLGVKETGKQNSPFVTHIKPEVRAESTIDLLFRPGHYDLAIPKA